MERYFLLIFDGLSAQEESFLLNHFGSAEITCDEPLLSSNLVYRSSYVYFLNLKKSWKKIAEWKEVNPTQYTAQLLSKSGKDIDEKCEIGDTCDSSLIAECLNSLADHLPLPGTYVLDIIVGYNIFESFRASDNVQFAASLHRLSKWHSARTSWLSHKTDDASNVKEWLELTNAEAIDVNKISKLNLSFWRGAIEFKDTDISTQCYNEFELRIDSESKEMHHGLNFIFNMSNTSEYLLLHPVLKVTDVCCFSSIPQHLILPVAFNVCVSENSCSDTSIKLCANIKERNDTALILRMGYSLLKEKPKPDKLLNTNRWLKTIQSGNVKYPESSIPFVDKYITLVVVPSTHLDCMSTYVLRDSSHLDAQFYFSTVSTLNKQSFHLPKFSMKVKDYSVPFISKTTFLSSLQKAVDLHPVLEESGTCESLSPKDTSDLLTTFVQCLNSNELVNFSDVDATYYEIDPSDWAERINLLHRQIRLDEETKHKKNVFMSFSPKRSRYYVSFSGDDIKNYFEPSGERKDNKTAEPIQSLGYNMNYNKDTLETVKETKWPEILNCVYDDIYYNATKQSEDNESFGNEMVKCYVQYETASTCNNHQNQPEAPITIQAKSMTPRKKPKNTRSETSFRQVMMNPNAGVKKQFLKTAVGQSDHVISTIIKTLSVSKSSNAASEQSAHKKRVPRKNSVPVRCSPRKKSSVEYYSSSRSLSSTNKVEKNKTIKENSGSSLSEVLKKKLRSSIASALESNGVNIEDVIFKPCFKRLFTICQVFVQDIQGDPRKLGTSQYIQGIAEEHVKPVIKFEKQKKKMK